MMVDTNTLAKLGRYLSGVLVVIFTVNLLLDSDVVSFIGMEPFLGSVGQFLILLAASALISIEFIIADQQSRDETSQNMESEPHTESRVDAAPES